MLASTHQPAPIWREHDLFDKVGVAYVDGGNHFDGLLRMTGTDHRRRFAARLLLGTGERHEEDDAEQVQAGGRKNASAYDRTIPICLPAVSRKPETSWKLRIDARFDDTGETVRPRAHNVNIHDLADQILRALPMHSLEIG